MIQKHFAGARGVKLPPNTGSNADFIVDTSDLYSSCNLASLVELMLKPVRLH